MYVSEPPRRLQCANKVGINGGLVRSAAAIRGTDWGGNRIVAVSAVRLLVFLLPPPRSYAVGLINSTRMFECVRQLRPGHHFITTIPLAEDCATGNVHFPLLGPRRAV